MNHINHILIENVLSTVYDYFKNRVHSTPKDRADFDFVVSDPSGRKTAIEVKAQVVAQSSIIRLADTLKTHPDLHEFILIAPESPDRSQLKIFDKYIKPVVPKASWTNLHDYLKNAFGLDINDETDLSQLKMAAITSNIDVHSKKEMARDLPLRESEKLLNKNLTEIKKGGHKISPTLIALRRQFPDSILAKLDQDQKSIYHELHIGKKYPNAIIILTDIKNFSTIVATADPDELNKVMTKYYTNARELVFKYNGILDKFIGDAVLAIFNYPMTSSEAYLNSLKFCSELILLGQNCFGNLLSKMDQSVESCTRIGISNGAIYTLNIGQGEIEVTFLGDKINLAARLEKSCENDGILVSNRFCSNFLVENPDLVDLVSIVERKLDPTDAKGQFVTTTAWQFQKDQIQKILEINDSES